MVYRNASANCTGAVNKPLVLIYLLHLTAQEHHQNVLEIILERLKAFQL
jgi:hypothetical protein